MRAALYARVSKDEQNSDEQVVVMRNYCGFRDWQIAFEVTDTMSGAKNHRPGYREVLKLATQRKLDVIVVWKLDRWGRSSAEILGSLVQLQSLGVSFVSVTEGFDLTTPIGEAMAGMLAVFAQFERSMNRERTKLGLERAKKAGKKLGRRATPALYRQEVLDFAAEGMSPAKIAAAMDGRVSEATVRRILKDGNSGK